jgi:KaiC/GvpD/RAD55 family RecA-like ATPase
MEFMTKRIKTFVKGLDEYLGGGIPEGFVVLLVGRPGTMKSSLAYSILHKNAQERKVKGLYVTLEQNRNSLIDNMTVLGMNPEPLGRYLGFVDLAMIRKTNQDYVAEKGSKTWMEIFKMYVQNLKQATEYEILVLDALPVLELLARFKEPREDLFHFFEWLRELNITTFLIHEIDETGALAKNGEDFLVDGILHMDLRRDDNTVNLFMSVAKMRKTNHKRGYYPLIYDKNGFEIVTD